MCQAKAHADEPGVSTELVDLTGEASIAALGRSDPAHRRRGTADPTSPMGARLMRTSGPAASPLRGFLRTESEYCLLAPTAAKEEPDGCSDQ